MFSRKSPFNTLIAKLIGPSDFYKSKISLIYFELSDTCDYAIRPLQSASSIDIFENLTSKETLQLISDDKTYFVFDYSVEGYGYKANFTNFYEMLTLSGIKHGIPEHKIFFISSNLYEEKTYQEWRLQNTDYKINVLSFNYWDYFIKSKSSSINVSIDDTVSNIKDKINFLSLNRRHRHFRTVSVYEIVNSSIYKDTRISFDKFSEKYLKEENVTYRNGTGFELDNNACTNLAAMSPSILDKADFETNWAHDFPHNLFQSTLIPIVSETLHDSYNSTSLFYSEKTFKPMLYNCPVFILGQPNANTSLGIVGYKTYTNYFDLSFDTIENYGVRLKEQIKVLEKLNKELNLMSTSQKVDWLLQDRETLEHNKKAITEQTYNRQQVNKMLQLMHSPCSSMDRIEVS